MVQQTARNEELPTSIKLTSEQKKELNEICLKMSSPDHVVNLSEVVRAVVQFVLKNKTLSENS